MEWLANNNKSEKILLSNDNEELTSKLFKKNKEIKEFAEIIEEMKEGSAKMK